MIFDSGQPVLSGCPFPTKGAQMEQKPITILIVDDDAASRESIRNMTAKMYPEFIIQETGDAQTGLESFLQHAPDIIFTDLSIPVTAGMDGFSMAAKAKALNPDVIIVALTADRDIKVAMRSMEIGIDHYVEKPLVYARLCAIADKSIKAITERRHREQMENELELQRIQLKAANELLEQRILERTADLEAAIREMESFSYSVSHDLRAPLRHISCFCSILTEEHAGEFSGKTRDYLGRICMASKTMGTLIDHLLELSRVTRKEINLTRVDLSAAAASTLLMYHETEPERVVEEQIDSGLIVSGDQYLLKQLLDNLLGNAWKYTSKKPVARIEFSRCSMAGDQVYFVRDNGAGFDMSYHKNLFKAFERLHGAEYEGVGIGLATAQRIIHRHGGRIWAEGSVDKGATIYFTLPPGPAGSRVRKQQIK